MDALRVTSGSRVSERDLSTGRSSTMIVVPADAPSSELR
jgi:hypothetical protein